MTTPKEVVVDSRGRRCPLPIIDLAAAASGAPSGTEITLLADDPAAAADVAAWCRMRGHAYEGSTPLGTDQARPTDARGDAGDDPDRDEVAYRVRIVNA